MSPDKLIHMVNQIARFMESRPPGAAAAGVADHVNDYWEPRMRRQLLELVARDAPGLDPLVVAAAPLIRRPAEAA